MKSCLFTNSMNIARDICSRKLKKGDIAVDCTMGKGYDTVLLAELVGKEGKVYAFDVQEQAINYTRERLTELGLIERTELILDGHEKIDSYVKGKVNLIIFNLGYLPGASHNVTTKAETTLEAVKKALKQLDSYGILLIVLYHGHDNGKAEKLCLEDFSAGLNQKEFNVFKLSFMNQINFPPELICIEKRN